MKLRLAALAVLMLVLTACGPDTSKRAPNAAPAAPTSAELNLSGLKAGAPPQVAFGHEGFLNGDTTKEVLPDNLDQFAETKQLLVVRDVDGNVYAYAPDGPVGTTPIGQATGDLAINAERNLVAWIAPDGSPTVLQEGEARPAVLEKQDGVESGDAVAVLGQDCFNGPETVEGAGCSVYFRSTGTDEPQSFVASNHGFVESLGDGELLGLQDVDEDGEIGWTKLNDDLSTCSEYSPRDHADNGTTTGWQTCDHMPLLFSPDGGYVLATGPHGYEGLGASELTIIDRITGKPTLTLRNNEGTEAAITDMVWEDNSHVLAVVTQGYDWAIVRAGLDGSVELAAKPIRLKTEGDPIPFRLAVQP